jgi:hypothetical protein
MTYLQNRIIQNHAAQAKKYIDYAVSPISPSPSYLDLAMARIELIKQLTSR